MHQWGGFLSARSGQCPPVTLNRPAMQSGPSDGRMRRRTTLLPRPPRPPSPGATRPAANPPPRRLATTLVGAGAAYAPAGASRCFNFFHPSPLSVSPLALVGRQNIVYVLPPPFPTWMELFLKLSRNWKLQRMDPLFRSSIQISGIRRTLRPDVAPIREGRGVQREMILRPAVAKINVIFSLTSQLNEDDW